MDELIRNRLERVRTIDVTTFGRRSGRPARIEIWWFSVDDRFIITGTPGPRDWYADVLADPRVIVHAVGGDHPARAVVIGDPEFRRHVFTRPEISWYATQAELDDLIERAPMIEVVFDAGHDPASMGSP